MRFQKIRNRIKDSIAMILTLALLLAVAPTAAFASWQNQIRTSVPIYVDYDTTTTSLLYCRISPEQRGPGGLTAAASTTTTVVPTGSFSVVQDEDVLYTRDKNGVVTPNTIKTYSSSSSVVVASSWTLAAGTAWTYRTYKTLAGVSGCGTAITDGWVPITAGTHYVAICVDTLGSTSVDYSLEGKIYGGGGGNDLKVIGAASISVAGCTTVAVGSEPFQAIRVGLKDTSAGTDKINVTLLSQS